MNTLLQDDSFQSFAFAAAALLCVLAALVGSQRHASGRQTVAWCVIAGALIGLAVLEAIGVQSLAVDEGRQIARSEGWYQDRREYQKLIIMGLLVAGACVAFLLAAYFHWHPSIILSACLIGFILVRAVSLHQVDALLFRRPLAGLQLNGLVQFGLLALLGVAACGEIWRWRLASVSQARPAKLSDSPEAPR